MRDRILKEIRRLTEARGGKPPGRRTFENETGIKDTAWLNVYWVRWGDAVADAGFVPNVKDSKTNEALFLEKLAQACRHYTRIPTLGELRMYRKNIDPAFPGHEAVSNFGGKANILRRLAEWLRMHGEYDDIAAIVNVGIKVEEQAPISRIVDGYVYLIGSGIHFKIGRCDQIERRIKQISVALPDTSKLVHVIRTDDPVGIEAYWHRRFADRRANGEWFKLTKVDVAAFKRRKFQ